MFGLSGILIALIVLTIALAGVFLVRSSITMEPMGKILAFIGLCILPALCIATGMSFHMQRSKQTAYCISCHSMESHGQSLYVLNASYIPAQHFQNHLVPPNQACYTCHTDYTMYGPLKDKLKGLRYLYMEYVSTPPKTIHLDGKYSNLQCLHCHAGMRSFDENPTHTAIMGSLKTNRTSCISCHNMIHNASEVGHLKMWVDGDAPVSSAAQDSSSAPSKAEPSATAGPSRAPVGRSAGSAIFDSQRCSTCHGVTGGGGSGPALTHISSQYPPAKLTAVLKAPTAKMKAAGMVALTLNAADMKALVSYVTNLGGKSATAAVTPPASSTSPAPGKAEPTATAGASKAAPAATPLVAGSTPPGKTKVGATAAPAKATTGNAAGAATTAGGKDIFDSQRCSTCHGVTGGGGSGPALTSISSRYPPAQLTAVLKAPTAKMKAAGMVALTLNAADMKALVSYVTSLGGPSTAAAATPPASGEPPTAPSKAEPTAVTGPSTAPTGSSTGDAASSRGKSIFDSQHCSQCHGATGGGGSGPALTHISSQYPPAQLTAVLKAPTPSMTAGGMVPLTVDAADLQALVSYVTSLGGTSAAPTEVTPGQYAGNKEDVRVRSASYPSAIRKDYRIFAVKCNQCHDLDKSLRAGGSAAQAVAEVNRMQSMASSQINDDQAKAVVDFLNYNRAHAKP